MAVIDSGIVRKIENLHDIQLFRQLFRKDCSKSEKTYVSRSCVFLSAESPGGKGTVHVQRASQLGGDEEAQV